MKCKRFMQLRGQPRRPGMRNRVRSKVHAAHEGRIVTESAGVHAILWDNGSWSYLYADEFVKLDEVHATGTQFA